MNCKNCKFFKKDIPYWDYYLEYKPNNANKKEKMGVCERVKYIYTFRDILDIIDFDIMYSCSEWGDATEIVVGENYGCVHFEQKEI